jgi:hypothetical protein
LLLENVFSIDCELILKIKDNKRRINVMHSIIDVSTNNKL